MVPPRRPKTEAEQTEAAFQREHMRLAGVVHRTTRGELTLQRGRAALRRLVADSTFRNLLQARGLCDAPVAAFRERTTPGEMALRPRRRPSGRAAAVLGRMTPQRRAEAEALMDAAGCHTQAFARVLLAATQRNALREADGQPPLAGLSASAARRMRRTLNGLADRVAAADPRYADVALDLIIVRAYVRRLLGDAVVAEFLGRNQRAAKRTLAGLVTSTK